MSRIDVVVPCYRYAHYLNNCIESVLGQQGVDVRVLILDDASPDHTPEVADELVRQDARVEYRRHEVNHGHINTYNEGLQWASGEYLLLLSADDLLVPGALRRAARVLDAHPEVVLVHGKQIMFTSEPEPAQTREEVIDPPCAVLPGEQFIESCCAGADNPVATPTAVVRTSVQHAIGGYSKALPHTADLHLWLRFAARGAVARIDADQAFKRMHASNMQYQYARPLVDLKHRQEAFSSFLADEAGCLKDSGRLQELVTRTLAMQAFWAASDAFDHGDELACQECLEYAEKRWPEVTSRREWVRLRWKRRLGSRLWQVVRPLMDRWRGTSRVCAQADSASPAAPFFQ